MGIFREENIEKLFADVILPFPLNQAFTYSIPSALQQEAAIGKRAVVQFGKKKVYTSLIVKIHKDEPEKYKAKQVIDILDEEEVVYPLQIKLWQWIADYYCSSIGEVMAVALPSSMKLESESKILLNPGYDGNPDELNQKEHIVTDALIGEKELPLGKIQDLLKTANVFPVIKSLYLKGVVLPKEELKDSYKPKTLKHVCLHPNLNSVKIMQEVFESLERAPKQLDALLAYQIMSKKEKMVAVNELAKKAQVSTAIIRSLVDKNIFTYQDLQIDRLPDTAPEEKESFQLTGAQENALTEVVAAFKEKQTALLHGITSSGKTHIYIKLIEEQVKAGKQVLYLVPEIALTAQLINRLNRYFGKDIGIYHSKFSANERYEIWHKTLNKEYKVVLGVRSALFLPFKELGLIIVDEEHENTFKQQNPAPRYQARDVAVYMASLFKCNCLLGTATPSFESYFNAKNEKYAYIKLDKTYSEVLPPVYQLSDMKDAYRKNKMKGHLSFDMFNSIKESLEKKEQVILFQNRRGFATMLECLTCGWIPRCKNCDISLTYHKYAHKLHCHYCGYKQNVPKKCDQCGNTSMEMKGFGTERIEDDVELLFPDARHVRVDLDTTRAKNAYKKIFSRFEKGEAEIMIGTQMVTKGLDFENVKLVGVLNADQMMNFPDFRAMERSYQLMAQVAGRAGRRKDQGKVVIQTFSPGHPLFQFLTQHNYDGFFEMDMKTRQNFNYPPFSKIIKITFRHKDLDTLIKGSQLFTDRIRKKLGNRVMGPEFPPVMKLKNQFINQVMIKFERNYDLILKAKNELSEELGRFSYESRYRSIRIIIDVDPY